MEMLTCSACGNPIRAEARFCDNCGMAVSGSTPSPSRPNSPRWYYNVWFVLFMLFFVAGPFGLPLVWKNPRFSQAVKWLLTLAMVGYTYVLIVGTVKIFNATMSQVEQLKQTLPY